MAGFGHVRFYSQRRSRLVGMALPQQVLEAFVLGLVEGVTEFLPISSMAHLKVVPMLLGWGDPGLAVGATIQLGSILAVILYFRKDLLQVLHATARSIKSKDWASPQARLGQAIFAGTIPVLVIGIAIKILIPGFDHSSLRSLHSIGVVSVVMAALLATAERMASHRRELSDVQVRDGILVGCAQTLAIIPGVSRSGSTLTASLFDNWKREDAARFSFLLGIPTILLVGLAELGDASLQAGPFGIAPLLVGIVTAFASSILVIHCFIQFLRRNSTTVFVLYRLAFGVFLIAAGQSIEASAGSP